ncbi:MAG TPA: two-component regulator propeller domain-containing protein [Pyrinomonadaceae bacterium]
MIYESVIRIYQDSRGFLWFCTNVGVSRFDGYQFTSYAMQDRLPNPTITDIIEDGNGIFWLGTNASGVYRFDPRRKAADENSSKPVFDSFTVDDDKNSNAVTRFFKTRRGEIYLATEGGLYRLHDEEKEKIPSHRVESAACAESIFCRDRSGGRRRRRQPLDWASIRAFAPFA